MNFSKIFKTRISNYLLVIIILILSFISSKYSFWYDVNSFYSNLLRNYEGQKFLQDYFCQFFPIQFFVLSPFLKFINLNSFIILFSIFLNLLFAFQFSYYSKKILNFKINSFYLFVILSFFFIPFGIGSAHHNELAIYFCTIGFLIALSNIDKVSMYAVIFLVFGLTVKYSIAIPLFAAIFFSFSILLISEYKKSLLVIFVKYIFFILLIFTLIIFIYKFNSNLKFLDILSYLFIDTLSISQSRIGFKDFILYNLFNEIFSYFKNFTDIKSLPVGSFFQLPIVLSYFYFIYYFLKNQKRFYAKEKIFFYFLIFASIFLFVSLGRDWNHKIIFFIITNYFLFFIFFNIEKKLTKTKINFILICTFSLYLLIPLNERVPLKNFVKDFNYETKDYFFKFSKESPFVAFKRSIYETNHGINNLHQQYSKVTNYLSNQKDLNLFFVDDLSTIFSTVLSKAPSDTGCFHTWLFTPPINKGIREKWINVFLENYNNKENSMLVICKTDDGRLCLFSPTSSEDGEFKAVEPTKISDNEFIKQLIANSKISFRTKNFYIYEKK